MANEELKLWGPLAPLIGVWEGDRGDDIAPGDDRGTETNAYRESIQFEKIGPIQNHEQVLYGVRYMTMAWRKGEADAFHEEVGYWLWDAQNRQVMKSFCVPRGIVVLAGGTCGATDQEYKMKATLADPVYGITANPFLNDEFQTVAYELSVKILSDDEFEYDEDTQIQIKGKVALFHHRDKNRLKKVK